MHLIIKLVYYFILLKNKGKKKKKKKNKNNENKERLLTPITYERYDYHCYVEWNR